MPKLIDYPRTNYTGAWEVAEVVDDTGGKCALETCARKLNRKVSGSFKAIIGSAVKFGLLTSKREMLTTTTLFRRIKHAYDKQEELVFHREAFLTPPLFTQICRKFRARELPVAMLDVLLMREFEVEEINAQGVAKAFIDGAHMVGLLNEHNIIADIDQLAAQQPPRRELASVPPPPNVFRQSPAPSIPFDDDDATTEPDDVAQPEPDNGPEPTEARPKQEPTVPLATAAASHSTRATALPLPRTAPAGTSDAIANLFGLGNGPTSPLASPAPPPRAGLIQAQQSQAPVPAGPSENLTRPQALPPGASASPEPPRSLGAGDNRVFRIQLVGPGLNTELEVVDVDDLALVRALLDKIERRLKQ